MTTLGLSPSLFAHDSGSNSDLDAILKQYDPYIFSLAKHTMSHLFAKSQDELDLEIDELAQRSRIKLWLTLRKRSVGSLKSYIRCIVHTEFIDFLRHKKPWQSLSINEEGEVVEGTPLLMASEVSDNPEVILGQREALSEDLVRLVDAILRLSKRQRQAFLCNLKDKVDDVDRLADILGQHDIDIKSIQWPEDKEERQILKASFSPARRAIAQYMDIDMSMYRQGGV